MRTRAAVALVACAVAGALVTGCGHSGGTAAPAAAPSSAGTSADAPSGTGSDSPAPSDADLARMKKLVDDADSAAAAAESDAAGDK